MTEFSYSELVNWATDRLPGWQQDALRRLVEGPALTAEDLDELVAMALAPHVAGSSAPTPSPPQQDHDVLGATHPCVQLVAVRDILRANALAPGPITFGPSGLTVIYGGNAAGKSGVARILKKACHAQEPGARILPNVFEPDPGQPASATIDFLVDGEAKSHRWIDGQAKSQFLRAVNVFDSRCAAVRIEKASIVAYTPRILQLFRELALVVDRVAEGLKEEKAALGNQPASLASLNLDNTTEAGQFVANLSAKSSVDELETTCRFDNHDRERILSLNRALADDPEKRAFSEEARARRMQRLDEAVKSTVGLLDDIGSSNVQNALDTRNSAREAAEVARKAFEGNSDLAGVGSKAWRSLWESARKFSEMHAYANEPFPVTRSGAVCVLCQQKLSPEAGSRLVSFESFVKAEVQREADDAELELATAIEAVQLVQLPKSVTAEVREAGILGSPEGEAVRRFLIIAKMRRRYLLALTRKQKALHCPDLPSIPNLAAVRDGVRKEAKRIRAATDVDQRRRMKEERAELTAREVLSAQFETVRDEIGRLRRIAEFDAAIEDCKTQPITLKRREAAKSVLTDRLRSNFESNLLSLGFGESPVEMKLGAGERGEHPVRMQLVARPEIPPEEVLSEGERTCAALAGLLAELDTTGNRSALALDDPVSSLDHQYRKRVAERIVREAKERQVVVFTHDIVFLYLLRKYRQELGVPLTEVTVERGYKKNHAQAKKGPPWVAMPVGDRIKTLRTEMVQARRELKAGSRPEYERLAASVYKRLRMSWERAIEEVLLNQTVVRFGDSVQTKRLVKLTDIDDDDLELVTREMSRCSDFEHDESGAVYAALPEPDVIEADIRKLDDWVNELRRKRGRS